jgi:hypothetical protein
LDDLRIGQPLALEILSIDDGKRQVHSFRPR